MRRFAARHSRITLFLFPLFSYAIPAHAGPRAAGGIMCACPGMSRPLGGAPSCEVACFGAKGGGGGGGLSSGAQIGQALGASIVNMMKQSAAQQKAQQELLRRQELMRLEQLRLQEIKRQEAFDANRRKLLNRMGSGPGSLRLKDDVEPRRAADLAKIKNLHNAEAAARRKALERLAGKPEELWCKLHLPQALLLPQSPINDAANRYPGMVRKFLRDRGEWDNRCGGPASSGPTPLDEELALLASPPVSRPAPPAEAVRPAPARRGKMGFKDDEDETPVGRRAARPAAFKDDIEDSFAPEIAAPAAASDPPLSEEPDAFELAAPAAAPAAPLEAFARETPKGVEPAAVKDEAIEAAAPPRTQPRKTASTSAAKPAATTHPAPAAARPLNNAAPRRARRAVGCILAPLLKAHHDGAFSAGIEAELNGIFSEMAAAGPSGKNESQRIYSLTRDALIRDSGGERQTVLSAQFHRIEKDGEIRADIQYSVKTEGSKTLEGQNIFRLSASGDVLIQELAPAAAGCLN